LNLAVRGQQSFEPITSPSVVHAEAIHMMPDQLARQEQIARRLERAKRLVQVATDAATTERIREPIGDNEQTEEKK
jgi:hypothetical protein